MLGDVVCDGTRMTRIERIFADFFVLIEVGRSLTANLLIFTVVWGLICEFAVSCWEM